MKLKALLSKKITFQVVFLAIVAMLFVIKCALPSSQGKADDVPKATDSVDIFLSQAISKPIGTISQKIMAHPHRILGVSNYETAFPDGNDEQLISARHHGVAPQQSRKHLDKLIARNLVRVNNSPYYAVDKLKNSIPYLVPRARKLLAVIGRNFADSLQMKMLPQARLTVTSVLRSIDDVTRLQGSNINSTNNSCHFYGTTFDISYTRYQPSPGLNGGSMRVVRDDTLKWVLSEVLRDLRQAGACHVKHERKQGCFHITVK